MSESVTKSLLRAAKRVGISTNGLGTHTERRSVVSALYADGAESIEEIANAVSVSALPAFV